LREAAGWYAQARQSGEEHNWLLMGMLKSNKRISGRVNRDEGSRGDRSGAAASIKKGAKEVLSLEKKRGEKLQGVAMGEKGSSSPELLTSMRSLGEE